MSRLLEQAPPPADTVDVRQVLSPWYLPISMFADRVRRIDTTTSSASFTITEPGQCGLRPILLVRGTPDFDAEQSRVTNTLAVTGDNTEGHFREGVGLELFPGYEGIGSLIQAASFAQDGPVWLRELPIGAAFSRPVVPGMEIVAEGLITQQDAEGFTMTGKVIRPDLERHTATNDMRFEPMDMPTNFSDIFAQNQLIEVAAQMAGGAAFLNMDGVQQGLVPVFLRVNPSTFEKQFVRMGDTLQGTIVTKPNTKPDDPRINSRVLLTRHNGDAVADIGVVLAFYPFDLIATNVQAASLKNAA